MAVDLKQLGKLLALTRSGEPEEATRAEEIFTNLFFRWCDEQGLRENVGFARVGDVSDVNHSFLESVAGVTSARVLQLNAFDLCLVGTLPECQAVAWWFENILPEVVDTSKKSAYAEREAFQAGACRGIFDELWSRREAPVAKALPATVVEKLSASAANAPSEAPPAPAEPTPVRVPSPKEQGALRDGHAFGRKLAVRAMARAPYRLY